MSVVPTSYTTTKALTEETAFFYTVYSVLLCAVWSYQDRERFCPEITFPDCSVMWTDCCFMLGRSRVYIYIYNIFIKPNFLGAYAKLSKATISFVMFVILSVRPSAWKNSASIWHIFVKYEYFSKIRRDNSIFIKMWPKWHLLYMKINIHPWSYVVQFFLEWEMLQTKL